VTNPLQPVLLGFSTTATNPRALATVTNASFVLPGGGLFSGNLLVVAGGGRVAGGELAAKVEVYDVDAAPSAPSIRRSTASRVGSEVQAPVHADRGSAATWNPARFGSASAGRGAP